MRIRKSLLMSVSVGILIGLLIACILNLLGIGFTTS
jgi:hypothetical protein